MAYQKLQAGSALAVIKSDDVDIPNPASLMVSSTTTSATASQLNDTSQNFNTLGVQPGDIIYDSSNTVASKVNFVVSDNELNVTPAIASGANYKLYAQSSLPSNGCVLYIGSGGDVSITTVSGDTVLFKGLVTGQFVPVQTIRVNSTGTAAADIVALW